MGSNESFNPKLNKLKFQMNKGLDRMSIKKYLIEFWGIFFNRHCKKMGEYVDLNTKLGSIQFYFQKNFEDIENKSISYLYQFKI